MSTFHDPLFPLDKAAEGHIYLDAGKSKGKGALKELVTFSFGQRH